MAPYIRGQAGRRPRAPPSVLCLPLECDRFPNDTNDPPPHCHLESTCNRYNIKTTREMLTYVYGCAGSRVRGASEETTWHRTVRSVSPMHLFSCCQLPAPPHPHVPSPLLDFRLCSSWGCARTQQQQRYRQRQVPQGPSQRARITLLIFRYARRKQMQAGVALALAYEVSSLFTSAEAAPRASAEPGRPALGLSLDGVPPGAGEQQGGVGKGGGARGDLNGRAHPEMKPLKLPSR